MDNITYQLAPFEVIKEFDAIKSLIDNELIESIKDDFHLTSDEYDNKFVSIAQQVLLKLNSLSVKFPGLEIFNRNVKHLEWNLRFYYLAVVTASFMEHNYESFISKPLESINEADLERISHFRKKVYDNLHSFSESVSNFKRSNIHDIPQDIEAVEGSDGEKLKPKYILDLQIIWSLWEHFDGVIWEKVPYPAFQSCFDFSNKSTVRLKYIVQNNFIYLLSLIKPMISEKLAAEHFNVKDYNNHKSDLRQQKGSVESPNYSIRIQIKNIIRSSKESNLRR